MIRRRYRVRPPSEADHTTGEMIEFGPGDDLVNAGKSLPPPVTLTPVGHVVEVLVFTSDDDRVANPPKEPSGGAR